MSKENTVVAVAKTIHVSRTRSMIVAALMAALLAASAWIVLPIGAVPVTLQVFIVLLVGLLLSPGWAAASVGVYVLMGAIGVPVFSGGMGGLGHLAGPTGGYIIGFLIAAPAVAFTRRAFVSRGGNWAAPWSLATLVGIVIIYTLGWLQLSLVTGMGLLPAFVAGVLPFVVVDLAKAVVAVAVAGTLRRTGMLFD